MELHLRRFLFRHNTQDPWMTFGYTRANFGDLAAGLMLEIGKRRAANLGYNIDPLAAQQLKDKSYVDDSILGGSRADVERMRGERTKDGYSGTVGKILARGALTIKFMAVTGSSDPHEQRTTGREVSGSRLQYRTRCHCPAPRAVLLLQEGAIAPTRAREAIVLQATTSAIFKLAHSSSLVVSRYQ